MFKDRDTVPYMNYPHCDREAYIPNIGDGESSYILPKRGIPLPILSSSCSGDEDPYGSTSPSCRFLGGRSGSSYSREESDKRSKSDTSSPTDPDSGVRCYQCGQVILARYYVLAMDRHFHNECLKCHICHTVLSDERTCFEKEGRILCKQDYYRLYHDAALKIMTRCARCAKLINPADLVMKVREYVYHVGCFVCTVCQRTFNRGDHFRMQNTDLFCRLHHHVVDDPTSDPFGTSSSSNTNKRGRPPKKKVLSGIQQETERNTELSNPSYFHQSESCRIDSNPNPMILNGSASVFLTQDGVPSGITENGSNNATPPFQKGKRMRTTFKHNQLRIMKSYFEVNPNPDTKDLKQLSQKTGLCKRVLQVWFQNARAKQRRNCSIRSESSLSGSTILHQEDSGDWSPPVLQSPLVPEVSSVFSLPPAIQG